LMGNQWSFSRAGCTALLPEHPARGIFQDQYNPPFPNANNASGTKTTSSDRSDVAPPLVACVPRPGHTCMNSTVRSDQQTHATITNHNTCASRENCHQNPHQVPFPQCPTFTLTRIQRECSRLFLFMPYLTPPCSNQMD